MNMSSRDPSIKNRLLKSCPNICFICGYSKRDQNGNSLLEGAHIKDNAKNSAYDNVQNMILLCPNHHTEYDRGLIDFDTQGVVYTADVNDAENGIKMAYYPSYIPPGTIKYHNEKKFKGSILLDDIY